MTTRCKGPNCGAEVVFVRSAKTDKQMILDATPTKAVLVVDGTMTLHGMYAPVAGPGDSSRPEAIVVDVFTDHHATCPDAASFKRSA